MLLELDETRQTESTNEVPPEGKLDAKIALVGEAPGAQEDRLKKPFIGSSGELLFDILASVGVLRSQCYVTNVIKVRPPNNDASKFIKIKKSGVSTTDEFKAYVGRLKSELETTSANVIVAVGNIALYALTGMVNISKRRGSIYESTLLPGRKVIPIIHPASALRNYQYTHFIRADLARVVEESETPAINIPNPSLTIVRNYEDAMRLLNGLNGVKQLAYDIEVINGEVSHIAFAVTNQSAFTIPFYASSSRKNIYTIEEETKIWLQIGRLLEDSNIKKIIQNASFDTWFLFRKYGIVTNNILDTMIAQAIAFPDFPKGLDFLCSIYTKMPYYKDDGKQYMKIGGDDDSFSIYNAKDAVVLPEIMVELEKDLKQQGNYQYFLDQCKLVEPLTFMSEYGIAINKDGLENQDAVAKERMAILEEEFRKIAGIPDINLNSSTQIKNYFYVNLGIKPYTKTVRQSDGSRKTSISVDEKALKRLASGTKARAPRKEAAILLEYRKLKKLSSTYYDLAVDNDNRFRPQFNPVGTRFSRLSSGKNIFGKGGNLQNIPKSIKPYFLADKEHLFFNVDLSQADWRIVAYLAMESNMISALEANIDIHKRTAALLFNKPEEQISDEPYTSGYGDHSERFIGKKLNHSLNYNLSANELALQLQVPLHLAREIHAKYYKAYPGIPNTFWTSIKNQLYRNRTITNLFGRRYTFTDRMGNDLYKAAYAYIPQSTVADIINRHGLLHIYNRQDLFSPVKLVGQVHDSLMFQVPINAGWEKIATILRLIKARLETPLEYRIHRFVIPAEFEAGITWGSCKKIDMTQNVANQLKQIYEEQSYGKKEV